MPRALRAVATYLNIFLHTVRAVGMANMAQMVNVLGPIITRSDGLFLQTIYHPLRVYAEQYGPLAVDSHVASAADEQYACPPDALLADKRLAGLGPFDYLDVAATVDPEAQTLTLCVVNRHPERDLSAQLVLRSGQASGQCEISEINGESPTTRNSFEEPEAVVVHKDTWRVDGVRVSYCFPAHSITVLKLNHK